MEKKMGRKADDFWQYVDKKNGNKCIYCGHGIPGASRIKFHLAQVTGQGIRICDKVPDEVKTAAVISVSNSFNKRVRQSTTPSDFEENSISSSLLNDSTRGKGERKQDDFWKHVDKEKRCKYCGIEIPGASRIKFHLAQVTGGGIRSCDKVPVDVRSAAILALNSSNNRVIPFETPSDLNENNINSNLPSSSTRAGEIEVDLLPTTDLVGEQFKSYLDEMLRWVMGDDEISIMGVWGMGGVGKTALLKHIHNELRIHKHRVIWITVSQNYSTSHIQRVIAGAIGEDIAGEDDEMKVAARLLRAFKKMNNCIVILDDVWYDISLEDVGIPLANNGIRIIVASRLRDVCESMGCKENIVTVRPLEKEADNFALFSKNLGDDVTRSDDIRDIARDMTWTCEGLPLAIVTIARSMRGKADIREWRNALSKLRSPEMDHDDIKRCVFPRLKSSFDHLNDRTLQDCFLCTAFYQHHLAEDSKTMRGSIKNFVDEGLIDGRQSSEAQLDEGHSILNKLTNNRLLEGDRWMHRLVWAMALNIGKESHGYLCKKKLPDQQEWKEDLRKIYLYDDEVTEIPSTMLRKCHELVTFRMCYYSGKVIPNYFFTNTYALKLLDLSWNGSIESLPESISDLECLTVLLLRGCESLRHIPSLAKLRKLRKLDLSHTAITQVPLGFENLTNLRWLDLRGTAVMISKDLERLQMLEGIAAAFVDKDEFNACIQIIEARINSGQMKSYNLLLRDVMGSDYDYGSFDVMGSDNDYGSFDVFDDNKIVMIDKVEYIPPWVHPISFDVLEINKFVRPLQLPTSIDVLEIEGCNQWKSLCDVFSIQQSNNKLNISECSLRQCNELEYLFCSSYDCILCSSLQGLSELRLIGLNSLSMLCKENEVRLSILPFSHVTKLSISNCKGLKRLLTPVMLTQLNNLEKITVSRCESMEEIFSTGRSINYHDHRNFSFEFWSRFHEVEMDGLCLLPDTEPYEVEMEDIIIEPTDVPINSEPINLPKLKSVSLQSLPQLKSVCKGILVCGSLEKFDIINCPKLECIPQTEPHFEIQVLDSYYHRI